MRIGIVTFHRVVNAGGFLQAYALQQFLRNAGHDAMIANHIDRGVLKQEMKSAIHRAKGFKRFAELLPIWRYRQLQQKHFHLSPPIKDPASYDWSYFDVVVFGSDELWNYENFFYGLKPFFFGHGIEGPRKVSYAPSFGEIKPTDKLPEQVVSGIKSLDAVAVRDHNSVEVVKTQTGITPELVLDPTLIYDFEGDVVADNARDDALIVYATSVSEPHREQLRAFAKDKGLRLVSLGTRQWWCDEGYDKISPFEVLGWFSKAPYVFTNTFHGTIFATKFGATSCINIGHGKANKILSLSRTLGLENRILKPGESCADIFERPVASQAIQERLADSIAASRNYLLTQCAAAREK
ncbi:MAG: polysaccharide pyruvyl transferase family protein [Sumerlaeia bacterium]